MKTWVRVALAAFVTVGLLRSCFHFSYRETPYREVYVRKIANDKYELEFRYQVDISGNMHGPSLPFSSQHYDNSQWFYVDAPSGKTEGSRLVLTHYRGCTDPLYWQKAMTGYILLEKSTVEFSLKMPRYDTPDGHTTNIVQRYETWEHNGSYSVVYDPPPSREKRPSDYRPSSCDRT